MAIKILYVEDEQFLGEIVKETLETRGYEVTLVSDGEKVISTYKKCSPNICVLDIMLPNKSGYTIAQELKQENNTLPIIFVSAKVQTEDVVKGFYVGGDDYMRKPFSMEELIVRIERLTKTKQPNEPALDEMVLIASYNFYTKKQLLLHNKAAERKLSHRETELLKQLYLQKDHIIDRRELLQTVWGDDSYFNSRNLDVYITKLRSYFKDDSKIEILTIKGIGYKFLID